METALEEVRPARRGVTPPSQPDGRAGFLSDVVVELGYVDNATADWAVEQGRVVGQTVASVLLESNLISEDQLSRAIAELHGLDHVDLAAFDVDLEVARLISKSAASRYEAVPIGFDGDGALLVALADPVDPLAVSDIAVMTKSEVHPMVAARSAIDAIIEKLHDAAPQPTPSIEPHLGTGSGSVPWEGPQAPAPPDPPPSPVSGDDLAQVRRALADLAARVDSMTAPPAALEQLRREHDHERQKHARTEQELRTQLESAEEEKRRLEQRLQSVLAITAEVRDACERLVAAQPH